MMLFPILERHQNRRLAGVPTITVLSGPPGLCLRSWQDWLAQRSRPMVHTAETDPTALKSTWVRAVNLDRLRDSAIAYLAMRTKRSVAELAALLAAKIGHERELLWQQAMAANPDDEIGRLARIVLDDPKRLATLGSVPNCIALMVVLAPAAVPGLLLHPPPEQIGEAAGLLAELAAAAIALPVALAASAADLENYQATGDETRAKALLRETVVTVHNLKEPAILARLGPAAPAVLGSVRRLAGDGASPELVERFAEAAVQNLDGPPSDGAKSAAERFLHERLESLCETAGLFQLNGEVDFRFGQAQAEIDLLCASLKLAIEIDGYYHFQDAEAYRRDRRKDLELQRRDYLVLRFLATDVVARLEEILDTIRSAVSLQQQRLASGEMREP